MVLLFISLLVLAYLLGSFNSAIILVHLFFRKDIREYGSGNAGATNVYRTFGAKMGFAVFALDAFKGWLAVSLVYFFPNMLDMDFSMERVQLQVVLGAGVMLGHIYPLYYGFRGGKGVATVLGVILGVNAYIALGLLVIFMMIVASTSYVSLGSMIAALAFPAIVFWAVGYNAFLLLVFAVQVACFTVYTHRKNIARLLKGEENKFIFRK